MGINGLCNRVTRIKRAISPIRRAIIALCEVQSNAYYVDGKALAQEDIDRLACHKLIIRMIPDGLISL